MLDYCSGTPNNRLFSKNDGLVPFLIPIGLNITIKIVGVLIGRILRTNRSILYHNQGQHDVVISITANHMKNLNSPAARIELELGLARTFVGCIL